MANIFFKTDEEIEIIRENCLLVSKTLALVAEKLKPGITGLEIDKLAEDFIRSHNAVPGFKDYNGFPSTLCVSINDAVVHGIPSEYKFKEDDIVSVDCGVLANGYYGDAAYTFAFNNVKQETIDLMNVTKESLHLGIESAIVGNRIGDIGFAIQKLAEKEHSYGVVRELVGHGIGQNLHEEPQVPNFGRRGSGVLLKDGLVIAIEPMINLGTKKVKISKDGWTIVTADNLPSAHFEHTIAIRKSGPEILSNHEIVEFSIKKNEFLKDISIKN